jgi:hypothetical protein
MRFFAADAPQADAIRYPPRAGDIVAEVQGAMAQLVARFVRIEEVRSSNLLSSTILKGRPKGRPFLHVGCLRRVLDLLSIARYQNASFDYRTLLSNTTPKPLSGTTR